MKILHILFLIIYCMDMLLLSRKKTSMRFLQFWRKISNIILTNNRIHTSEVTDLEFAFACWCLMVTRHLTAVFDMPRFFETIVGSEVLIFLDSSTYIDLPSISTSPTSFSFLRSKESFCVRNDDTTYFRFCPKANLFQFFSGNMSRGCLESLLFLACDLLLFLLPNPKKRLPWRDFSSRVKTSSWTVTEDAVLEATSIFVLDANSEISSASHCLSRGKFSDFLNNLLDSFTSGCKTLNLFKISSCCAEGFAR